MKTFKEFINESVFDPGKYKHGGEVGVLSVPGGFEVSFSPNKDPDKFKKGKSPSNITVSKHDSKDEADKAAAAFAKKHGYEILKK